MTGIYSSDDLIPGDCARCDLSQRLSQGRQLLRCQFAQVETDYSQIWSLSKRLASEWELMCEEWIGVVKDGERECSSRV